MKESSLRKMHRILGPVLAVFLLLQGGSGLLISAGNLAKSVAHGVVEEAHGHGDDSHEEQEAGLDLGQHDEGEEARHGSVGRLHHGHGIVWDLYRVIVGTGLMVMVASGMLIYLKSSARMAG